MNNANFAQIIFVFKIATEIPMRNAELSFTDNYMYNKLDVV